MFTARVATSTTSTAAGLLTLGWLHGGGTLGRFGFFYFSYIFSLSIWALFDFTGTDSLEGSGLVSYGKEPKPQGRSAGKGRTSCALAPSFPILLLGLGGRRLTLMLHEMTCFPPTHRVCCSPVRLCHSRCCARTSVFGLIRSITGKQQTTQGPSIRRARSVVLLVAEECV